MALVVTLAVTVNITVTIIVTLTVNVTLIVTLTVNVTIIVTLTVNLTIIVTFIANVTMIVTLTANVTIIVTLTANVTIIVTLTVVTFADDWFRMYYEWNTEMDVMSFINSQHHLKRRQSEIQVRMSREPRGGIGEGHSKAVIAYSMCMRVLATEIENFRKILVASARTHACGEKTLLSSRWTLIGSELSSPPLELIA